MSRLASFRGPSTPTSSPAGILRQDNIPASPSRPTESTFHRKTRTILQEIRRAAEIWDDLVLIDGLKAARSLIDARTELDNIVKLIPDRRPRTRIVIPSVAAMEQYITSLDAVVAKLEKQFQKMNHAIESLEQVLIDAHKAKGWQWVYSEPLWVTWSLEKFVTQVPKIIPAYHRSLHYHVELVNKLRPHSTSFEDSREIVNEWTRQPWLEGAGWRAAWEDLCEVEVERW